MGGLISLIHIFANGLKRYPIPPIDLIEEGCLLRGVRRVFAAAPGIGSLTNQGNAQPTFRILHQFDGSDGAGPYGHLISAGGKLYGMTAGDTIGNKGMALSIDPDGSDYTILHRFNYLDVSWIDGRLLYFGNTL